MTKTNTNTLKKKQKEEPVSVGAAKISQDALQQITKTLKSIDRVFRYGTAEESGDLVPQCQHVIDALRDLQEAVGTHTQYRTNQIKVTCALNVIIDAQDLITDSWLMKKDLRQHYKVMHPAIADFDALVKQWLSPAFEEIDDENNPFTLVQKKVERDLGIFNEGHYRRTPEVIESTSCVLMQCRPKLRAKRIEDIGFWRAKDFDEYTMVAKQTVIAVNPHITLNIEEASTLIDTRIQSRQAIQWAAPMHVQGIVYGWVIPSQILPHIEQYTPQTWVPF